MSFACPGLGQTDSVITNHSDQKLKILSGIKFYIETINFEGMVMLSCSIIGMVLLAQNEFFFFFFMLNVFREETMAFMLVPLNLTLIKYPVRSHLPINNDFIYITMQLSLRRNCILKHDHV
jgi:hypothetical protein